MIYFLNLRENFCNQKNHRNYLRSFYFDTDEEKLRLKERLMEDASEFDDIYYNKIVLGIPCCDCFKDKQITNHVL